MEKLSRNATGFTALAFLALFLFGCCFHNSIAFAVCSSKFFFSPSNVVFVLPCIRFHRRALSKTYGLWRKSRIYVWFWVESTNNSSIRSVGEYTRENWFYVPFFFRLIHIFSLALAFYSTSSSPSSLFVVVVLLFLSNHANRFRLVFITINVFIISQYAVREQSHKII